MDGVRLKRLKKEVLTLKKFLAYLDKRRKLRLDKTYGK